ncbi:MAG TPA: hypothetical protein VL357_00815 [Rariglobus sp.]|jgi:hypothetical protein|nr:hypothetical protein [Rariglobus sp.]
MTPSAKRSLAVFTTFVLLVMALCLLFPRVLGFVELAARELRYLWWLVFMLALGAWLAFFFGKRNQ